MAWPRSAIHCLVLLLVLLLDMHLGSAADSAGGDEEGLLVSATIPMAHGLSMPRLGVGTAALGGQGAGVVAAALAFGVTLVDTAQAPEWYSEADVGRGIEYFLQDSRGQRSYSDVFVVTKIHPRHFGLRDMHDALSASRRLLMRDRKPVDLALLHAPRCWPGHCTREQEAVSWQRGWRSLEQLRRGGLAALVGVSNFDAAELRQLLALADSQVAAVQNWCDPFHQDREARAVAAEHGVVYMAYSPLGAQWEQKMGYNPVLAAPTLLRIAAARGASAAEVVLSWALQEGLVAIPRSADAAHLRANSFETRVAADGRLRCFLTPQDMHDIRALDGTLGLPW